MRPAITFAQFGMLTRTETWNLSKRVVPGGDKVNAWRSNNRTAIKSRQFRPVLIGDEEQKFGTVNSAHADLASLAPLWCTKR